MSNTAHDSEPTTDEIFASIRQMLTQGTDSPGAGGATPARVGAEPQVGNEIEVSNARPALRTPPGTPAVPHEPSESIQPVRPTAAEKPASTGEESNRLISENTAKASVTALTELMGELSPDADAATKPDDGALENATRALLRRLMKAWIDATLPSLVESIVREEIRSIVRVATEPMGARSGFRDHVSHGQRTT